MKNIKARLAFEMLEKEMEVLTAHQMMGLKGGSSSGDTGVEWGIDPEGNFYYRNKGAETWISYQQLFDVTVTTSSNQSLSTMAMFNYLQNNSYTPQFNTNPSNNTNYDPYNTENNNHSNAGQLTTWMNVHFGEGSYSGYGIATFANMSDNNNVVYDTEYDLFVYDSMGYNSMGYNSMGYDSMGYDFLDYNSMGYNSMDISSTIVEINPAYTLNFYGSTVVHTYTISATEAYALFGELNTLQNIGYSMIGAANLGNGIGALLTLGSLMDSDWSDLQTKLYSSGYTGDIIFEQWTMPDGDGSSTSTYIVSRSDGTPIGTAGL